MMIFGSLDIQPVIDSKRNRYNDTTIILALKANVCEISVRSWNTMLNVMQAENVLQPTAEIPSYSSMNRYSLMLPTLCKVFKS